CQSRSMPHASGFGHPEGGSVKGVIDERSLRALFTELPQPTLVYDVETLRICEVNDAATEQYGYRRDELLSMTIEELRGDTVGQHQCKDGRVVDVEITSKAVQFADRPAVLMVAQDITARRQTEGAKAHFLTAVAHELRTPLTSLLGFAQILQDHDGDLAPDVRAESIARIATNARKLERLVNDLLDVDGLGRGVLQARRRHTDVGDLVRRVANRYSILRAIEVDAGTMFAYVDPAMVERIIDGLIANAITHTPEGTRVWVGLAERPEGVLISVDDDGPGIAEQARVSVFETFEQRDPAEHNPGIGIGLALVAQFAALHNGRAWADERPGGGAALRVLLG
ncbi:MAG: ATP-binding protein, partial [Actinomycetes bacterium]